jgi:hypothetical protein
MAVDTVVVLPTGMPVFVNLGSLATPEAGIPGGFLDESSPPPWFQAFSENPPPLYLVITG